MATGQFDDAAERALADTLTRMEDSVSDPDLSITDGEQTKSSFVTYSIAGISTLGSAGVVIPFADGHTRQLPVITQGPFK
jgi:5-methyltetrahydropteroyltriglutamate--homocysteine methyltransferase